MGITIIKKFGSCGISSGRKSIKYIGIHYTAGVHSEEGSAAGVVDWWNNQNSQSSADFVVDDVSIVQYNGDIANKYCQSIGGQYTPVTSQGKTCTSAVNTNTINIEMCSRNKKGIQNAAESGDYYFTEATVNNAVLLTKHLMETYNIPISNVTTHHHAAGKTCPAPWCYNEAALAGWEDFLGRVRGAAPTGAATYVGGTMTSAAPVNTSTYYKVDATGLQMRTGAGTDNPKVDITLIKGGRLTITETTTLSDGSVWGKHEKGWVCISSASGESYMHPMTRSEINIYNNPSLVVTGFDEETNAALTELAGEFNEDIEEMLSVDFETYADELLSNLIVTNTNGIYGVPYQLMEIADRRLADGDLTSLGRKYTEKIIKDMPILFLTPGVPKFLAGKSFSVKKSILSRIVGNAASSIGIDDMDTGIGGVTKFYSLEEKHTEYYNYVNPMCWMATFLLQIQDVVYDGQKLSTYDWRQNTNKKIKTFLSPKYEAIPFYVHADSQISESFSNSTGTPQIASGINTLSDSAKELGFILGLTGSSLGLELNKYSDANELVEAQGKLDEILTNALGANSGMSDFAKSLAGKVQTITNGAKMIFPEIWQDSSFGRSFNINLRLTSPDCDTLSWYLNIWVPLAHLLGFTCPRGLDATNAYANPFILRGVYKGMFNIDMGIVTDMTVTRGAECCWTREGLPTVVEVSLSIKDLYSIMTISQFAGLKENALTNLSELDYVATACGIDITEPEVSRSIDMFIALNVVGAIKNIWRNVPEEIAHRLNTRVTHFLTDFFR